MAPYCPMRIWEPPVTNDPVSAQLRAGNSRAVRSLPEMQRLHSYRVMTQGLLNQHMTSHLCRTSLSPGIRQPTVFHKTVRRHTGVCHLQPVVYIQEVIGGSVTRGIYSDPPTPPNDGAHGLS